MGLYTFEACAGGGGLALGLERAGFESAALIDNDVHALATLRTNRPRWNVLEADLRSIDPSPWYGIDLVAGGLPCPPYSVAGKGLGCDDERDLFPHMLHLIKEIRPRAVLIENVRGLLEKKFAYLRASWDQELKELGFSTSWCLLNAADFRIPQHRYRTFLVALDEKNTHPFQWPCTSEKPALSVGEALFDLMAEKGWKDVFAWAWRAHEVARTIVGGSKKHGGPDLGPTRSRKKWAELGVDGRGVAHEPPEPDFKGAPRLTERMIARIQGFPDNWKFSGKKTHRCRQIGNALPPPLAEAIAGALKSCLS